MLQLTDVVAGYGALQVLHGVSLHVPEGKVVVLLGSNGAGKSTTVNTIAGLRGLTSGSIEFNGTPIGRLPAHQIFRRGVALVPQGRELFPGLSVEQNLELGLRTPKSAADRQALYQQVFNLFPRLLERRTQQAGTLSGGEQAMLATARAIMSCPSLLLLDEPTAGLAPLVVAELVRALKQLNRGGQTVLLIEQNVRAALGIADFVYVMRNGKIVAQGPAAQFTDDDKIFHSYFG